MNLHFVPSNLLMILLSLGAVSASLFSCQETDLPVEVDELMAKLPERIDYNFHVKPILSDRCFACHGPDANERKAGLRLDEEKSAYAALESGDGRAIVRGKPGRSVLVRRILETDPDLQMPPPESKLELTDRERAVLIRWIEQGAEYKPHWAFIKPERPDVPKTNNNWARTPIDHFIVDRLQREGLEPSPVARPETLVRRLFFDLTGLPPDEADIDSFLADARPDAYERLVDSLLSLPAYGERMAAHWLEVARFSDSEGYLDDYHHAMWPYRDWVIDAFTRNLPYDRFVLWQVGGDQIPDATREQVLATAFNRNHKHNSEGGVIAEEFRVDYVADRTNTLGEAFMGLTLGCARCHDHKYDPVSQKEYYELFAFFNSVAERGDGIFGANALETTKPVRHEYSMNPGPVLPLPDEEVAEIRRFLQREIQKGEEELQELAQSNRPDFERWLREQAKPEDLPAALAGKITADLPFDEEKDNQTPNLAAPHRPGKLNRLKLVEGKVGLALESSAEGSLFLESEGVTFERVDPFSISFWIYVPKHFKEAHVLYNGHHRIQGYRGWDVILEDNRVSFRLNHAHPFQSLHRRTLNALETNMWRHFTWTYDGSSRAEGMQIYENGEPVETEIVHNRLYRSTWPFIEDPSASVYLSYRGLGIGYRHYDKDFHRGRLDELKIFKGTLSALEAQYLYDPSAATAAFSMGLPSAQSALTDTNTSGLTNLFEFYALNQDAERAAAFAELRELRLRELITVDTVREIMVMGDLDKPRPTHILDRGLYDAPGEEVQRNTPSSILPFPDNLPLDRYGLGQWLVHEDHPLTARVGVNRLWQLMFGRGLVETSEDFGNQGALPSHPELLDWLAVEFRESGWDVKHMIRLMVNSAAYRQSSVVRPDLLEKDPDNLLLARAPRYRLPAEMVRDNALAVSGLLDRKIGGRSVFPYQPGGLWLEISNKPYWKEYPLSADNELHRRSIYTFWKRNLPPPVMLIFDAGTRGECEVRRQQTNTPLQALALMNDPQIVEACRVLAERTLREESKIERAAGQVFKILTGRLPTRREQEILLQHFEAERRRFVAEPKACAEYLDIGFVEPDPALPAPEVAALAVLANTVMNSTEGYYKN
jgi:hypothetical protein